MHLFAQLRLIVKACESLPYDTDGFIFTPINAPIRVGMHPTCYKWKHHPSVDIRLVQCPKEVEMFIRDGETDVALRVAFPTQRFQFSMNPQCALLSGSPIVECIIRRDQPAPGKENEMFSLHYLRMRPDRTHPNSVGTMRAVIQEVCQNITLKELLDLAATAK